MPRPAAYRSAIRRGGTFVGDAALGTRWSGLVECTPDLPVFVAATPLPRPVHAVTRPAEQVVCHGDLACAVVIVGVRILGHCPSRARAPAWEALLRTPVGARPLRHPSHPRAWGWRAVQSELGDDIS